MKKMFYFTPWYFYRYKTHGFTLVPWNFHAFSTEYLKEGGRGGGSGFRPWVNKMHFWVEMLFKFSDMDGYMVGMRGSGNAE